MGLPDQWDTCSRTMMFEDELSASAHWGDTIAIGLGVDVVFLDATTGIRTSVLCGHTGVIHSLAFSRDGTLLLSGSWDKTVRVWDVQTGGVIRTFDNATDSSFPASISSDGAMVALGPDNGTVRLCDVRTGESNSIKMYPRWVMTIEFSPTNSRRFISSSEGLVRQWDIDGGQIGTSYQERSVGDLAWTRDGTRFVSCGQYVATVQDSESGAVVVKLHVPDGSSHLHQCCFSPDGRFVACAADTTICVWDITISEARLVGHLVGHSGRIRFLTFSSSLISGGLDKSIKFWKSSSFSTDPTTSNQMPARGYFSGFRSIKLFADEGIVVTSGEDRVVKIWDVITGRCQSSFSTPAKGIHDTHLASDTLIIVWCLDVLTDDDSSDSRDINVDTAMEYHIWDVYKGQLLRKFHNSLSRIRNLKISGDGSKIFGLDHRCIAAVSMQTGELVGRVELESDEVYDLFVRGSKVWVDDLRRRRWDFGGPGVPPFKEFPDGPQLKLVCRRWDDEIKPCWMEDVVTKRRVFRSLERYLDRDRKLKWDGRYLFNWSASGEIILIIDFDPVCP